jgi:hypothetical protein
MYGGGLFQYDGRGVLFIQEFLGIKHSEGKRKDWARHGFSTVCIPSTLLEYE